MTSFVDKGIRVLLMGAYVPVATAIGLITATICRSLGMVITACAIPDRR